MSLNPASGSEAFKNLVERFSDDGMIVYSRGEAWEYLGRRELARGDYQDAARLFPLRKWKGVARLAIQRVEGSPQPVFSQWTVFHRIYSAPRVPDGIRFDALTAIGSFADLEHMAAVMLRMTLEELVVLLLQHRDRMPHDSGESRLKSAIDLLATVTSAPWSVTKSMHAIRHLGRKAQHDDDARRSTDYSKLLPAVNEIFPWADSILHGP